jgi:lysophospholipase L1-like esterase
MTATRPFSHRSVQLNLALLIALLLGVADATPSQRAYALPSGGSQPAGLRATTRSEDGRALLVVEAAGRFELRIDGSGIVGWYDLRSDPQRQANLVAPGAQLLVHRLDVPAPASGLVRLHELNLVRARVRIERGSTSIDYVIWAGGQVAYEVRSSSPVTTSVGLAPAAARGASLQPLAAYLSDSGQAVQQGILYLDAWMPEPLPELTSAAKVMPASGPAAMFSGALRVTATSLPLVLTLPATGGVRQPRFEIDGWPSAELALRRGGRALVEGADYLADWDAESGRLTVQYLHLLPPGEARSFELSNAPAAVALRLGIAGKDVDEAGLLLVDGNLPSFAGTVTTQDVFKIPYIQTGAELEATAAAQEAPAGARVRFVLNDTQEIIDDAAPFAASFRLPGRGTHRLRAELLDSGGAVLATSQIDPLAYGEVLVSIGDSITAGIGGSYVAPGPSGVGPGPYTYPIGSAAESPLASADGRNFYQANNWAVSDEFYYASFQPRLNDLLTACSGVPLFILNDGFAGIRTGVAPNSPGNTVVAKMAAYRSHIATLGARHVLLTVGANDVGGNLGEYSWANRDLTAAIDGLQAGNDGLTIWVGRVPWRNDGTGAQIQERVQRTQAYNALIPGIVSAQNSAATPVALGPDFYSYFENQLALLDSDRLHPTQEGYDGMAALWSATTCAAIAAAPPEYDNTMLLPFVQR